jgi:hypothetical protein
MALRWRECDICYKSDHVFLDVPRWRAEIVQYEDGSAAWQVYEVNSDGEPIAGVRPIRSGQTVTLRAAKGLAKRAIRDVVEENRKTRILIV